MACLRPLSAWRVPKGDGYEISFTTGPAGSAITLPCGQCIGCLLNRARQWSVRCVHEASMHRYNCFLTLTYDDYHLPPGGSLDKLNFTNFMKRLRKRYGKGIRFFQCGEYGDRLQRPHHHVCLFGFDFPDKYAFQKSKSGHILYRSASLEELWPYGFCTIGDLTAETAGYTARYCLKKLQHYPEDYDGIIPEYITMSRRPGIGRKFYEKYKADLYNYDRCVVDSSHIYAIPKRYDEWLKVDDPAKYHFIKLARRMTVKEMEQPTFDRLMQLEYSLRIKADFLPRNYEIV